MKPQWEHQTGAMMVWAISGKRVLGSKNSMYKGPGVEHVCCVLGTLGPAGEQWRWENGRWYGGGWGEAESFLNEYIYFLGSLH